MADGGFQPRGWRPNSVCTTTYAWMSLAYTVKCTSAFDQNFILFFQGITRGSRRGLWLSWVMYSDYKSQDSMGKLTYFSKRVTAPKEFLSSSASLCARSDGAMCGIMNMQGLEAEG